MRKDAVVLEIRKKMAVVLAPDGRFLRIRNQGYHVGQQIVTDEITPVKIRPVLRRTLLIAACLVLVLGSTALAASKYMTWSYAGLDIGDVSVSYTLNYRNEVLRTDGNSETAEILLDSLEEIPYEAVDDAVERMMDAAREKQESTEEAEVTISVASILGGTGRVEEGVLEGVDRSMEKAHPDETGEAWREEIRIDHLDWQDVDSHKKEKRHPQHSPGLQEPDEYQQPSDSPGAQAPEDLKNQPDTLHTETPGNVPDPRAEIQKEQTRAESRQQPEESALNQDNSDQRQIVSPQNVPENDGAENIPEDIKPELLQENRPAPDREENQIIPEKPEKKESDLPFEEPPVPDDSQKPEGSDEPPETWQPEPRNLDENPPEPSADQQMPFIPEGQLSQMDSGGQNQPGNGGNQPDHGQIMNEDRHGR